MVYGFLAWWIKSVTASDVYFKPTFVVVVSATGIRVKRPVSLSSGVQFWSLLCVSCSALTLMLG